jgi:hypothetical protein
MTAKELIKELWQILKTRKGKDYTVLVWKGLGSDEIDAIELVKLQETAGEPETDHIALQTREACEDLQHHAAGLVLKGKPELN